MQRPARRRRAGADVALAKLNGELHRFLAARLEPLGVDTSRGVHQCWPWRGVRHPSNWVRLIVQGKATSAAKFVWTLAHGAPPRGRIYRTCLTAGCLQIDHLATSRPRHGRRILYSVNPARLRQLHAAGADVASLAKRYRLTLAAVEQLIGERAPS